MGEQGKRVIVSKQGWIKGGGGRVLVGWGGASTLNFGGLLGGVGMLVQNMVYVCWGQGHIF